MRHEPFKNNATPRPMSYYLRELRTARREPIVLLPAAAVIGLASWGWVAVRPGWLVTVLACSIGAANVAASMLGGWAAAWPKSLYSHEDYRADAADLARDTAALVLVALATALSTIIAVFTALYHWTTYGSPTALGTATRPSLLDCVYFTVTTLGTVGYGDLHPVSQSARLIATAQVLVDLATLSIFFALILSGLSWFVGAVARKPYNPFRHEGDCD
jgi:hypothetical protein